MTHFRQRLIKWLEQKRHVDEYTSASEMIEALIKSKGRGICFPDFHSGTSNKAKVQVLAFHHFDISADGLLLDAKLGSVGLLHVIRQPDPNRKDPKTDDPTETIPNIESQVQRAVDQAAYLRHLLTQDRDFKDGVWFVELVFLIEKTNKQLHGKVGEVLRDLGQHARHLPAIGIGVLMDSTEDDQEDPPGFRRSFSWLMGAVEDWYQHGGENGSGSLGAKEKLRIKVNESHVESLRFQDFRLQGTREWKLASDEILHMVHGKNGSGKSSLTEAVELAVCGTVKRVAKKGAGKHISTLTNHSTLKQDSQAKAKVSLKRSGDTPLQEWTVEADGVPNALQKDFPKEAFIMDQVLMDTLTHAKDADRAETFLNAFFPEKRDEIRAHKESKDRKDSATQALPEWIREDVLKESTPPDLSWTTKSSAFDADTFFQILPNSQPVRKVLLSQAESTDSELAPWIEGDRLTHLKRDGLVKSLEKVFKEALKQSRQMAETWRERCVLLSQLDQGLPEAVFDEQEGKNIAQDLNAWLEAQVLLDLLAKERDVTATVTGLSGGGSDYELPDASDLLKRPAVSRGRLNALDEQIKQLEKQFAETDKRLAKESGTARVDHSVETMEAGTDEPMLALGPDHANELDEIFRAQKIEFPETKGVGEVIRQAWNEKKPVSLDGSQFGENGNRKRQGFIPKNRKMFTSPRSFLIDVGRKGAFQEIHEAAKEIQLGWEALARVGEDIGKVKPITQILDSLKQYQGALEEYDDSKEGIAKSFAEMLRGGLRVPLNELLALMTPARWAYEDVVPEAKFEEEGQELDFKTGEGNYRLSVDQKLNTAELNSMTIALFLLCALREENPLGMLILDDPLQNMDEMTVSAVARAFSRIMRLWKHLVGGNESEVKWRIVMLLHSQGDLELFREECRCATYLLPWLQPIYGSDKGSDLSSSYGSLRAFGELSIKDWLKPV